jgi:hypothetical protein
MLAHLWAFPSLQLGQMLQTRRRQRKKGRRQQQKGRQERMTLLWPNIKTLLTPNLSQAPTCPLAPQVIIALILSLL